MRASRFFTVGACLAAATLGFAQSKGEFRGERGVIRVQGFSSTSVDVVTGEVQLTGGGGLVVVEDTGSGMTLSGRSMSCTLHKNENGAYVIDRADISKDGKVVVNSKIADAAEVERRKRTNQPPAPPRKSETLTTLVSDTIQYRNVKGESELTFPGALTIDSASKGTVTRKDKTRTFEVPFKQQNSVKGAKGTVTFLLDQSDPKQTQFGPRRAHLDGPVRFTGKREETPPGVEGAPSVPSIQTFEATGATFDADYTASPDPTVILAGNVEAQGNGTGFDGKVNCDTVTVTMDVGTQEVKRYQFSGDPAQSKIHIPPTPKKNGGSR